MHPYRWIVAGVALAASAAHAPLASQVDSSAPPPKRFEWLTGIPGTLAGAAHEATRSKSVPTELGIVALTAVLIAADQHLYDETRRAGDAIGLSPQHPEFAVRVGGMKLFNAPTTISSAFYYLGDGWPTMMVAGAFYVTGKIRHNNRAVRTASEITESLLSLGIITQTIKRMTGRQTPSSATVPGGRWRPFTNFNEYMKNTPQYDAFPSGHLATAMSTVTVIALELPGEPLGATHWVFADDRALVCDGQQRRPLGQRLSACARHRRYDRGRRGAPCPRPCPGR